MYERSRPDFYICGGQFAGKTFLYAASPLRYVEFEMETEDELYGFGSPLELYREPVRKWTFTAESDNVTKIVADSYKGAFDGLFRQWSPGTNTGDLGIEGMKSIGQ